jgi:hypothetical protein
VENGEENEMERFLCVFISRVGETMTGPSNETETAASDSSAPLLDEGAAADGAAAASSHAGPRRVDEVIASTGVDVHPKKRRRLERMSATELKTYELRTLLTTACKVVESIDGLMMSNNMIATL